MEQQPPKTGKFALNYGIILGAISVAFGIILYSMDMHLERNWTVGAVGILIMASIIAMGILAYKKANGALLSLGQALKVGMGIALIGAIISVIYQYVLVNFIDVDAIDKIMELQKAQFAENSKLTPEQIDQQIEMSKKFFWVGYPIILIVNLFFGFIISLIAGLIMKKTESEY